MGAMPLQHEYDYPESDGQPMAETTVHWKVMVHTTLALVRWYEATPDVWVGSNLFLYYEKDKPGIAPDVLVVRGVTKRIGGPTRSGRKAATYRSSFSRRPRRTRRGRIRGRTRRSIRPWESQSISSSIP